MWKTTLYETSRLTIELRDIVDNGDNSVDIWNFEYPSYYTGVEKTEFERKVIDHYYFRQIGQETVGRFLHMFRTKILEIMPYYVQLYNSVEIMNGVVDPFGNVDITEVYSETRTGSMSGNQSGSHEEQSESNTQTSINTSGTDSTTQSGSTSSSDDKTTTENKTHKMLNTPQGNISNLDDGYLTEAVKENNSLTDSVDSSGTSSSESSGTSSSESSGTGKTTDASGGSTSLNHSEERTETVEHTYTKRGNQGVNTYAHDMIEFRQAIINVDMMIINELNELFLGVY